MNVGLLFLGLLTAFASVFMMMLILVQRGKGGGLTGALGGMGGQSAFGSKAGDLFTRITVITAIVWITLCMLTIARYNPPPRRAAAQPPDSVSTNESETGANTTISGEPNAPLDLKTNLGAVPIDIPPPSGIGITGPETGASNESSPEPASTNQLTPVQPEQGEPASDSAQKQNADGSTADAPKTDGASEAATEDPNSKKND
jgi:preprotein translocase subunit SecG